MPFLFFSFFCLCCVPHGILVSQPGLEPISPTVEAQSPNCQGKHIDWNCPPWPGTTVTICMSCFTTGGPDKEHGTNKPPPIGRVQERAKVDIPCPTTSQNPSCWHQSWLNKACTIRKDSESEWLAKGNLETNPITINPRLRATWQSGPPGFPDPTSLHPGAISQ